MPIGETGVIAGAVVLARDAVASIESLSVLESDGEVPPIAVVVVALVLLVPPTAERVLMSARVFGPTNPTGSRLFAD
jgi:hypothetical protein